MLEDPLTPEKVFDVVNRLMNAVDSVMGELVGTKVVDWESVNDALVDGHRLLADIKKDQQK